MKFELSSIEKEKGIPVHITTEIDEDGDIEVMANGIILLWIYTNGVISTCSVYGEKRAHLEWLGFKFDGEDAVVVE